MKTLNVKTKLKQLSYASILAACSVTLAHAAPEVEFNGVLEASIKKEKGEGTNAQIDTAEIGVVSKFNETVSAEIVLLSEDIGSDDETDFEVDTALIHFDTGFGVASAGKFTVPFTTGETSLIEDSLTLVEPVGYGVSFGGDLNGIEYQIYAADPAKEDMNDILGSTYTSESDLTFGDLMGASVRFSLMDNLDFNASYARMDGKNGVSAAFIGSMNDFGFIVEATDIKDEDKTRANIEASYDIGFGSVIASMQRDGAGDGLNSIGFVASVYDNTELKFQYGKTDPYDSNESKVDAVAVQLVYEF